jgi:hypothetical protein
MDDQRDDREGDGIRFRKLRIAWSVTCGVAAALIVVLWVISRSRYSGIEGHVGKQSFSVVSSLGQINIHLFTTKAVGSLSWRFTDSAVVAGEVVMPDHWGFQLYPNKAGLGVFVKYWVLVLMAGIAAAGPWIRWRFSLRTLLIVMTLIAVVLGLFIYFSHGPAAPRFDQGDFDAARAGLNR